MALVTWSEALAIDLEAIDDQHRHLIDLLNQLFQAVIGGESSATIHANLAALIEHTRVHFEAEEHVMEDLAYPGLEIHRAEHESLTGRILGMQSALMAGQVPMTIDTLLFLKYWLVGHMETQDMLLGATYR
jgi:hemerythrin